MPRVKSDPLPLSDATVVLPKRADATHRYAAAELARFLSILSGNDVNITAKTPRAGALVLLGGTQARNLDAAADPKAVGKEGYRLAVRDRHVVISATTAVGILYGVYGLLEELGMGFYAGGVTYPDLPAHPALPRDLDRTDAPAFRVRGNMLHYNFLCGCTDWRVEDYQFYFDQLARMRCNMLLMHWYDDEPGAAYEYQGVLHGGKTPNSLTKPWGALASLRTSEFSFGTGRFFDAEIFSSAAGEDQPHPITEIRRTECMWADAVRYARVAGIQVAAGFEAPRGSPVNPETKKRFAARVEQFLARNPDITHFALWQHEGGGIVGTTPPAPGTPEAAFLDKRRPHFDHLSNDGRIWEAIRFCGFAEQAAKILRRQRPEARLVVVGWGGDRWMRFGELCLGFDAVLPPDVIFTCHDNIDASFGPHVTTQWGELPPERERWAMPWVEGDIDECWVRQPHVETLGTLAPDALVKGAQGLLTLQWRTRAVEEETGYVARFAWNPDLTPKAFYRDLARHSFGPANEKKMGRLLGDLQNLGARWTGVRGSVECGKMCWTGWTPHYPFNLDASAPAYLLPLAEEAAETLAIVPPHEQDSAAGAFHLRTEDGRDAVPRDPNRLGVAAFRAFADRLRALRGETRETVLRSVLTELYEECHALRVRLVHDGMYGNSFRAVDGYLFALHHLIRNAGASRKLPKLDRMRKQLESVRTSLVRSKQTHRLERLDYLAANMDFVRHYDRVAMQMTDGEMMEQALAEAEAARSASREDDAIRIAAACYERLIESGMAQAVDALTRKLTNRCDWGVLCTFNVKALPLYWRDLARLEAFLPAVPPREVYASGQNGEAWISWDGIPDTAYRVYRRKAGRGRWACITKEPVRFEASTTRQWMVIDRPKTPGLYEYALTAATDDGWESPRSHAARCDCRPQTEALCILQAMPPDRADAGQAYPVRVIVLSDRPVASVRLSYRRAGEAGCTASDMLPAFRQAWTGQIPATALSPGRIDWFVTATDVDGNEACWPDPGRQPPVWSLVIL